ncbi:hypothetical protein LCGC14_2567880 [marine sediment metagenome]|uniref:Homeodomain phBC6A51-type domain-containing protein n=1 Tax=marine sediment metagenome TaxID=412755 RepID=A0A0F9B627_9ZZZZ
MPKLDRKFKEYFDWKILPEAERIPLTQKEYAIEKRLDVRTLQRWDKRLDETSGLDIDEQIKRMDDSLYDEALRSTNAKMKELWYTRHGLLIQKSVELKVTLDADEYAKLGREAERELREGGFYPQGEVEVQEVNTLLPENIR